MPFLAVQNGRHKKGNSRYLSNSLREKLQTKANPVYLFGLRNPKNDAREGVGNHIKLEHGLMEINALRMNVQKMYITYVPSSSLIL